MARDRGGLLPARGPELAGAFAMLIGCLVLLGWAIDSATLKGGILGRFAMKTNSAICFVLFGVAVWMTAPAVTAAPARSRRRMRGTACTLLATLIGARG